MNREPPINHDWSLINHELTDINQLFLIHREPPEALRVAEALRSRPAVCCSTGSSVQSEAGDVEQLQAGRDCELGNSRESWYDLV